MNSTASDWSGCSGLAGGRSAHNAFPDDRRVLYKLGTVVLHLGEEARACDLMAKAMGNGGNPVKLDAPDDPNAKGPWA